MFRFDERIVGIFFPWRLEVELRAAFFVTWIFTLNAHSFPIAFGVVKLMTTKNEPGGGASQIHGGSSG